MDNSLDGQYASDEDIFDDEEDRQKSWSFDSSALLASLEKEFTCDKERLVRARRILGGRLPLPPNCTNPQISLDDVIARLKSPTLSLDGLIGNQQNIGNEIVAGHDVYLNRNEFVEELEVLRPALQEWFVSNETGSLLTTVPQRPVTASAKKRSRTNGWSASPNSRVNYLQRRKNAFSTLHSTSAPRTLTIDKGKLTKSKAESKEKQTRSSLKRALFQSPEKQLRKSNSNSSLSIDWSVPSASSGSIPQTPTRSQRVSLSSAANNEKKNNVPEKTSSEKKKCWRSLQFAEGESKGKGSSSKKLSKMHHKKMLWAVDHLLKSEGVLRVDPEYRQLCLLLYRETTAVWLRDHESQPRLPGTSTSNEMLRLANTLISSVEQKAGVKLTDIRGRRETSDMDISKIPEYPSSVSSSIDTFILNTRLASMESECSRGFSNTTTVENVETVSVDSYLLTSDTLSEASFPPPTPPTRKARNTPKKMPRKGRTPCKSTPSKTKTPVKASVKTPVKTPTRTPRKAVISTPSKIVTPVKRTPQRSCKKVLSPTVSEKSPETVEIENDCVTPRYPKRKRKDENEDSNKKSKYAEESDDTSTLSTPVSKSTGCDEETTDKENNSAIRNADLDSQNWSPIIIMKRMTRNRWSSQLKKKRVSSNMQPMKGVDESPNHQQPFLELEGPFMYRNAGDRALQCGEYIKVLLSGKKYIKWRHRLVRDLDVTPTCILVHPTSAGLELHIPIALICDQQTQLLNTMSNAVEEVLEDALLRLSMLGMPRTGFCGFTPEDAEIACRQFERAEQGARLYHLTGSPFPKPLFRHYQYALVPRQQPESKQYYQLEVVVLKMNAFIAKRDVDEHTILVHPSKCESSKRIILQLSIPFSLLPPGNPPCIDNVISDLRACQSCY